MLGDFTVADGIYVICGYTDMRKSIDGLCAVGKYRWPRNRNEVKPITWRQFDWLMSGLEIEQPKAIKSTGNA